MLCLAVTVLYYAISNLKFIPGFNNLFKIIQVFICDAKNYYVLQKFTLFWKQTPKNGNYSVPTNGVIYLHCIN